ncbi:AI-2E family transporter [Salimicrobium halophilum]|uniref:Predicted PurR-regulated permease PerM n=1 Tax=Salimicrobium halophilum TaxID=86666 RepID=A0A1G8UC08_9BACI|nr:AI-2E family transporter [Salimicrobium halophilum]SDJ51262.1 Predicted PurR-regulated permease PerM [Salimicrobium halophilum]
MWWRHPYFKYITAFILFLIAVFFMQLLDMFSPFLTVFQTLFYPILIAGFLFYLTRPVVEWMSRKMSIPILASIIILFTVLGALIATAGRLLATTIQEQVEDISHLPSKLGETAEKARKGLEENDMGMLSTNSLKQQVTQYVSNLGQDISEHFAQTFTTVAGAATVIIIVPFVLFFFLKDGRKLVPFLTKPFSGKKREEATSLFRKLDATIAAYIIGQATVAFVDGVLMYIGYLIIGLDYALILGLFVVMTAIIPFFGPIIGVVPAVVVALMQDPVMAIYVLAILVIVQQLEGNLVAPVVLGQRLHVHPLTIILLLVVAAPLGGFIGMVIAIPLYSVIKVLLYNFYRYFQMYRESKEDATV